MNRRWEYATNDEITVGLSLMCLVQKGFDETDGLVVGTKDSLKMRVGIENTLNDFSFELFSTLEHSVEICKACCLVSPTRRVLQAYRASIAGRTNSPFESA